MSTVELIVFCVLLFPMIAVFIWALIVETKANVRIRRNFAILAEIQTTFYRVANCVIREKYKNIFIERENNNEN